MGPLSIKNAGTVLLAVHKVVGTCCRISSLQSHHMATAAQVPFGGAQGLPPAYNHMYQYQYPLNAPYSAYMHGSQHGYQGGAPTYNAPAQSAAGFPGNAAYTAIPAASQHKFATYNPGKNADGWGCGPEHMPDACVYLSCSAILVKSSVEFCRELYACTISRWDSQAANIEKTCCRWVWRPQVAGQGGHACTCSWRTRSAGATCV